MYEITKRIFAWISILITTVLLAANFIFPVILTVVFGVKWLALWTTLPIMFILFYAMLCLFEEWLEG